MAVAVEQSKTPRQTTDYKVWYLEIGDNRNVQGIGVKSREELVQNLFENYRQTGKSNWRAFKKESEQSTPIEIYDFISMNINENTHFGNLPTLAEFQQTLDALSSNFELRSIA
jgi:hypothetical protein